METVQITYSNKTCKEKPTSRNIGRFFGRQGTTNRINFKTEVLPLSAFENIIGNGHVLSYQCEGNDCMCRKSGFIGTQYIIVDVDKTDDDIDTFLSKIERKPTIIHTSFSNLKEGKYSYHLIYVFNGVIHGVESFLKAFTYCTKGYTEIIDNKAKDPHRIAFTSNKNLPNYRYIYTNIIYNINNIYNISVYDIYEKSILSQLKKTKTVKKQDDFCLSETFLNDINELTLDELFKKYNNVYTYRTETPINKSLFKNGYADLRNIDYYVVPTAQFRWSVEENKPKIEKIMIGNRDNMLWLDALAFMKIIPDITKEHLVFLLIKEVFLHFDNSDGEYNVYRIIEKAKQAWQNRDTVDIKKVKKSFKIDLGYWNLRNINFYKAIAIIRKEMKDNDFNNYYDFSKTVEENLTLLREMGIKTTKKTLVSWLENKNEGYVTKKELRNLMIKHFYDEDNKRSCREIERLCKENGVDVSYKTVQRFLNTN